MPLAETLAFNQALDLMNKLDELRIFVRRWLPGPGCTHNQVAQQPEFVPFTFPSDGVTQKEKDALRQNMEVVWFGT
jgi:hypothetical protein